MSWPLVSFPDVVGDFTGGNPKVKSGDYLKAGSLPVIDQGKEYIGGYVNDKTLACSVDLPVVIFGDHTKELKFLDQRFAMGADSIKVLKPNDDRLDEKYLYYFLKQARLPNDAGYSRHFKFLKRLKIPLPPLDEQKRIAAILDKADGLRRKREKAIQLTDTLLRAVFLDMFGDPVTNPKGWPRRPFCELAMIDTRMVDPKKAKYIDLPHIGPDVIERETGKLLPFKTAREEGVKSGKYLFGKDHIIYTKIRPYLQKVALPSFEGVCSADVYPISPIQGMATKEFLWAILISPAYVAYFNGLPDRASIPKINMKEMNAYQCIAPPIEEQVRFSNSLKKAMISLQILEKSQQQSVNLSSVLTQRAFRGELTG